MSLYLRTALYTIQYVTRGANRSRASYRTLTVPDGKTRLHVRGGGRCSEQFKRSLDRKKTHSSLNKSCFTNDSESIEHPSVNHEKFGRYGTSGTCRGGGISSVKVRRAEIAPKSASEAACHPENTWGPSIDRSRATCGPKQPRHDLSASGHRPGATRSEANPRAHAGVGGSKGISVGRGNL